MKVQRIRIPPTDEVSWLVLDDAYVPIAPVSAYLGFLRAVDRSPFTVRTTAYHLKLFWEFLREESLDWMQVDVPRLAAFIGWLRRPAPSLFPLHLYEAQRADATIDQVLTAVHGFYDFQMRVQALPDLPLYRFVASPTRRYKTFLHGIAKDRPRRTRVVEVRPERRHAKTLTQPQVAEVLDACVRVRDRFLLSLLYETGMRIGQALGLRHEDIRVEDNEVHVVPRFHNANHARAKRRSSFVIPGLPLALLHLYTDYLVTELGALETNTLPDYVFVNLWQGQIGQPMTYETVMSLFRRVRKKTGIYVAPHMFRHTRATMWLRDDHLSLESTAALLGHASIQTTHDTYVHLTTADVREELRAAKARRAQQQESPP